ncbi:hypothetical protein L211DRAFT_848499 [Terfezia boudieri ATCC MYA-4762]|uniref:DUF7732 domain-containing protein n=1 Tax=Terfezia boudieri ATCC MYA-4762 TaxID=1051890 RepID=A0A3N4LU08_9PEZI|nr:hypothetical protein L211DRAFT_848499 [Terfezia boudieri ATCC MYA-4762]
MKDLLPLFLGLLGLAVHTSAYPQAYSEDLNLQQIGDEPRQIQLPSFPNPELLEDVRNEHIDVIANPEDELPAWKKDYYAALDTLDDDLTITRRAEPVEIKVLVDSRLVKRKGGGAGEKPKDSGTKWYKPWRKPSPPSSGTITSSPKQRSDTKDSGSSKGSGQKSWQKDSSPPSYDNSRYDNAYGNNNNGWSYNPPIYPRKGGGAGGGHGGRFSGGKKTTGGKTTSGSKKPSPGTTKDSNAGGLSKGGTGPPPKYTKYYSGGVKTPYTAGKKSPGGLSPVALPLALAGGLFAGMWLGSVLMYAWNHPLNYFNPPTAPTMNIPYQNSTTNGTVTDMMYEIAPGMNVTLPVKCLCAENAVCGCDEVTDPDYAKNVLADAAKDGGKGDTARLAVDDGKLVLVVNGTLPNGTTADGGDQYDSGGPRLQVVRGVVRALMMAWVGLLVGGAVLGGLV